MSKKNSYNTALYLRLSRDDADIDGSSKTESNSIGSQRDLLCTYIQSHEELRLFDIYTDDGFSGSNFDRPEFRRMMEDIRTGRVNCVLVKDLSRFGRDYIEAGRLIQRTFPAFHVRFIAVTDYYDSLYADRTDSGLILPVKNFVNDSYCRDISMKVKAQQNMKRMEGKCISAFTAYGYQKNPLDKNHLIVDPYAADVVKNIFAWKIAGLSMAAIADKLNTAGILSPMEYKKSLGMKYHTSFGGSAAAKWAAASVKRILVNQVYIGTMVQGKEENINYKIKKRMKKPPEEWICVKDTHEAIISKREFALVQDLLKYDMRASFNTDKANLFGGILICADCKMPMIKRVNSYNGKSKVFYICRTKNKSLGCSRHSVEEAQLKRIVFKEIKKYLKLMVSYPEIEEYLNKIDVNYEQAEECLSQIAKLQMDYSRFHDLKSNLYLDLEEGLINEREFDELQDFYERKCTGLKRTAEAQKKAIKDMYQNSMKAKAELEKLKETLEIPELSRELLVTTVRKIYVHEDRRLEVVFRFSNEMTQSAMTNQMCRKNTFRQEEG